MHGIKESLRGGTINIIATGTAEGVTVSVIDDGAGMEEERAEAVNAYARGTADPQQAAAIGVGFKNVIDRIRLLYADRAKLSVSSSTDWGTIISLEIPLDAAEADPDTGEEGRP